MRISLITLGDPETPSGGYLYHRRMAELAPANGAEVAFVSFPHRRRSPAMAYGGRVRNRALGADAVVLDSIAAAFVAPWRFDVPVAGMLHQPPGGIDHGGLRTRLQASLDRAAYRRCKVLMVASEDLVAAVQDVGREIVLVAPGRDVAPSVVPASLGPGTHFLCVANWMPRKGIVELLDAFARLQGADVRLHLVGDSEADAVYARRVRERLASPDLTGRVVVHGPVDRGRVAGFYAAADAFVLPSFREPYGTVYGEAMAQGLPVVGWDAGNLPNLACDQEHGFIVPVGDRAALSAALQRLAEDGSLRRRFGDAARRRGQTFPTWEQSAKRFFETVRGMLG